MNGNANRAVPTRQRNNMRCFTVRRVSLSTKGACAVKPQFADAAPICEAASLNATRPLVQPENLNECDARRVVYAAHDRGVIPRRQRRDDGGFLVIGRRK